VRERERERESRAVVTSADGIIHEAAHRWGVLTVE
jgi:hypothetical protein